MVHGSSQSLSQPSFYFIASGLYFEIQSMQNYKCLKNQSNHNYLRHQQNFPKAKASYFY